MADDYTEPAEQLEPTTGFADEIRRAIESVPSASAPPAPAVDEREAIRQRWLQPSQPAQPQEQPIFGVSPLAREMEGEGWFAAREAEHAAERDRERQEAIRQSDEAARYGGEPPPEYAESTRRMFPEALRSTGVGATQIPGGAITGVGSALQAPDVVVSGVERSGQAGRQLRLEMINRIDRGEPFLPADQQSTFNTNAAIINFVRQYRSMTDAERARTRSELEAEIAAFNPTPIQERPLYQAGEAVQQYGRGFIPLPEGYDETSFSVQVGRGLGSMLAGMPATILGGPVGGAVVFGSMGMGEATQRAVNFDRAERAAGRPGLTQDQIILAGLAGVVPGTTDVLPIEVMLGRLSLPVPLPPALRSALAKSIARIGGQILVEGAQEGSQQLLQNLIAWQVYNPDQVLTEDVVSSLLVGGPVGGIAQTAREAAGGAVRLARRGGRAAPQPESPAQPEAAQPAAPATPPEAGQPAAPAPAAPEAAPTQPDTLGFDLPVQPAAPEPPPEAVQPHEVAPAPEVAPEAEQPLEAAPATPEAVAPERERLTRLPRFEDVIQRIPKDVDGNPDVAGLQQRMQEKYGVSSWQQLNLIQRVELFRELGVEARDREAIASARPAALPPVPTEPQEQFAEAVGRILEDRGITPEERAEASQMAERFASPEAQRQAAESARVVLENLPQLRDQLGAILRQRGISEEDVARIVDERVGFLTAGIQNAGLQPTIEAIRRYANEEGQRAAIEALDAREQAAAAGQARGTEGGVGQAAAARGTAAAGGGTAAAGAPAGAGGTPAAGAGAPAARSEPVAGTAGPGAAAARGPAIATGAGPARGAAAQPAGPQRIGAAPVGTGAGRAGPGTAAAPQPTGGAERGVRDGGAERAAATPEQRTQLRSIIASRFPLNWGTIQQRIGATPEQMETLREEAASEGLLRKDRSGVYKRVPQAVQATQPDITISPEERVEGAIRAREAQTGKPVSPAVRAYAVELLSRLGSPSFMAVLERAKGDEGLTPADARDLAAIAGTPVGARAGKAISFASIEKRNADYREFLEKQEASAEAVETLAAFASGLDMSPEARKARAEAMGFDTSTVYYHATRATHTFEQFKIGMPGLNSTLFGAEPVTRAAIFVTKNRDIAEHFADQGPEGTLGAVMPLYVRLRNTLDATSGLFYPNTPLTDAFFTRNGLDWQDYYRLAPYEIWQAFDDDFDGGKFREALLREGYDSVEVFEDISREELSADRLNQASADIYLSRHNGNRAAAIEEVRRDLQDAADQAERNAYRRIIEILEDGSSSATDGEVDRKSTSVAILDPSNIRSVNAAFAEDATPILLASFASSTSDGQSQRAELDALGYYSKALEAAKAWPQKKGEPQQLLKYLTEKAGVKRNEIEATKLKEFLEGKKSVFRDDDAAAISVYKRPWEELTPNEREEVTRKVGISVVSYLRENRVEVREAVYAGDGGGLNVDNLEDFYTPEEIARLQAQGRANVPGTAGHHRWSRHSLARDDNNPTYRETVLHLPPPRSGWTVVPNPDGQGFAIQWPGGDYARDAGGRIVWWETRTSAEAGAAEVYEPGTQRFAGTVFRSGHFPEPNIVADIMSTLNVDANGDTTFVPNQVQSDWGQNILKRTRDAVTKQLFETKWKARQAEFEQQLDEARATNDADLPRINLVVLALQQGNANAVGFDNLPNSLRAEVSAAISEARQKGEVPAGARDERKIAELEKRVKALNDGLPPDAFATNHESLRELARVNAELNTAKAATPGNPLVNTTDQWLTTTLRHVIRQAIAAGAKSISIPSGETVLDYNPQGREEGNADFYDNIVPLTLRKVLQGFDKSIKPHKVATVGSPVDGRQLGKGFTVFPITEKVRERVEAEGLALFSLNDRLSRLAAEERQDTPQYTDAFAARLPETIPAIESWMRKMLPAEIAVRVVDRLFSGGYNFNARFTFMESPRRIFDRAVEVALSTPEGAIPPRVMLVKAFHEITHALREYGRLPGGIYGTLLTAKEWQLVVERAKKVGIDDQITMLDENGKTIPAIPEYRKFYREMLKAAGFRGAALDARIEELIDQERVANLAEQWADGTTFGAKIDSFFERIVKFFEAIRNAIKGLGFKTYDDVFRGMASGEVAARAGRREPTFDPFPNPPSPSQVHLSSEEGREARDLYLPAFSPADMLRRVQASRLMQSASGVASAIASEAPNYVYDRPSTLATQVAGTVAAQYAEPISRVAGRIAARVRGRTDVAALSSAPPGGFDPDVYAETVALREARIALDAARAAFDAATEAQFQVAQRLEREGEAQPWRHPDMVAADERIARAMDALDAASAAYETQARLGPKTALASFASERPAPETRPFSVPGFDGSVTEKVKETGERLRTYSAGGSDFILSEQPDGSWELTFFKAEDASRVAEIVAAIENDIGKPISPKGWLTPQGYSYWLSVAPEKVKYHVNAGELFGGMIASPRAVEFAEAVLAEAVQRRQDAAMVEYRGQHGAPDAESGSPIHDVTFNGIYPADFYSPNGLRYYGTGNDDLDAMAYAKIQSLRGKPNAKVTVYRAVPHEPTAAEQLETLEKQMAAYMRRKTLPPEASGMKGSDWYDAAYARREELRNAQDAPAATLEINPGDWVAINREYARDHGESALNGKYKIISKSVPARELFTAGDSLLEWGWSPPTAAPATPDAQAASDQNRGSLSLEATQSALSHLSRLKSSLPQEAFTEARREERYSFASRPRVTAAIKIGDEVFTGANHGEAMDRAAEKLGQDVVDAAYRTLGPKSTFRDGFVDEAGHFMTRAETAAYLGLAQPGEDVMVSSEQIAAREGLDMSPEARKARAEAMGFDTSRVWHHGTKAVFDAFDLGMGGRSTNAKSARMAVFFANKPNIAGTYARNAKSPSLVQAQDEAEARFADLERRAAEADSKLDELFEKRDSMPEQEYVTAWNAVLATKPPLDEIFAARYAAIDARRAATQTGGLGGTWEETSTIPVYARFTNPYIDERHGRVWHEGRPLSEVLEEAKAAGHDAVIFRNIYDAVEMYGGQDYTGDVLAVFDPSNIRSVNAAFDPSQEGSPILLASFAGGGRPPPPVTPMLPETPASQEVRGLADIIADLKSALGLTTTQGLYGMRVRDRAGRRTWGFRPQAGVRSQYDPNAGVARVRIATDIDAIAREGGRHIERVFGAPMQAFLQTNAEELAVPAAPDTPLPPLNPTGFSGIDLDADTQRVLVEAATNMRAWQAMVASPSRNAATFYDVTARAAISAATLRHRLGRTIADALVVDLMGMTGRPEADYVQERYSATGTPTPRVATSVAQPALSTAFADFFRRYITDPDGAKRDMPGVYTAFEEFLDAYDPAMLQDLERVQLQVLSADYKAYQLATAVERGTADVATMQPESLGERLGDWYQSGRTWGGRWDLFKNWLSWVGSSLSYELSDRTNPILKTQQALLRVADANGVRDSDGRPISLQPSENAHRIARMQSGADKIGHQMITHGVPDYNGLEPVGPSLHDALVLALGGTRAFQWNDKAIKRFGLYLEARRAVVEWNNLITKQNNIKQAEDAIRVSADQRRALADRAQKDRGRLERARNAAERNRALLLDRRRALGRGETKLENTQERLEDIRLALEEAQAAIDDGSDVAKTEKSRKELSLSNTERRQREALKNVEDLQQAFDELSVQATVLDSVIAQNRAAYEASSAAVRQQDAAIDAQRQQLTRTRENGIQGPPTRRDLAENQQIITELEAANPNYRQAAQMVYDWQHRLLTLEYMAGKWTQEAYDELTKRKDFYVPFMRDLSDLVPMAGAPPGSRMATRFTEGKKFKGSQRDIINPIESLIKRAHEVAAAVQFNDMVKALTNLSERAGPGGAGFVERVQKEEVLAANQRTFDRIRDEAIRLGVDPADAHMIVQQMEMNFTDTNVQVLWNPDNLGPSRPPMVPLWENGERKLVRLNDPVMGRRLFDAMNALGREQTNLWIRTIGYPASVLRAGVTMHPAFVVSNVLADMQSAWALTGAPPVITQAKGLYYLLATNPTVNTIMRSVGITPPKLANLYATVGGLAGGQNVAAIRAVGQEFDVHSLRQKGYHVLNLPALGGLGLVGAGVAAGGLIAGPVGATIGASVGAMAARMALGQGAERAFAQLTELSETVTRLGVAAHAAKRARKLWPNMSDIDVIREAAFTARDVIDFDRAGARAGTLLKLVPFLNSAIQGTSKAYRQSLLMDGDRGRINMEKVRLFLRWQLMGTGDFQQKVSARDQQAIRDGARLWVNMMILAAVATAIAFLHGDDPEYDDVRKEVRNTHYVFKLWGTWFRVKKPFELAHFANIGEAFYDWMAENDPRLMERMWASFRETHTPPFMPQGYNLLTGWVTGVDPGRPGSREPRPIVPDGLSRLPAAEQYNAYTSAFALAWSRALEKVGLTISPMMIDWTLNNELAYWGREIRVTSDYFFSERAPQWTDTPIMGTMLNRFTHDPSRSSQSIQEFWNLMGRGKGEFDEAFAGYDALLKRGNPNAVMAYLAGLAPEERTYAILQRHFTGTDQATHPLNRANIIYRVNSGMRREMAEPGGLINTSTGSSRGQSIPLAPAKRAEVDNILGRLSALEAWNALHLVGRPGWGERQVRDPQPVLDELQAAAPEAYAEMMRRRKNPETVGLRGEVGTFQNDVARWRRVEERVNKLIEDDDLLGRRWERTFRNRRAPTRQMQQPVMVQ